MTFKEQLDEAIRLKDATLLPKPETRADFIDMLSALGEETKNLNRIIKDQGDYLADIHGMPRPKPEPKVCTTTAAESPFWAPGAVYRNPNLG